MSNLIVMPGSKEFNETLATKTSPAKRRTAPKMPEDLTGKTLMLNTAVIQQFQCGGFHLGSRHPFAIVGPQAQQAPLHIALAAGNLIDMTGKDMTKGYKGKGGETSAIAEVDTGKQVFIATDGRGNLYIAAPKSKAEGKRFEKEIRRTGTLKSVNFDEHVTGFAGGITEEVVESSLPAKKPTRKPTKKPAQKKPATKPSKTKAKKNVSSSSRKRRPGK